MEFVVSALFQRLEENENFRRLVAEARAGKRLLRIAGLASGAKALALVALQRAIGRRLAVVSLRDSDLEDLERDLRFFYCHLHDRPECENEIFILPASESDPYSGASPHAEILERRALALWRLAAGAGDVVMLTARSLMRRFVAVEDIKQATVALRVGEELPLDYLIEHLASVGYVRSDPVGSVGEFSSRGGILDFYSPSGSLSEDGRAINPVRVERAGSADFRRWAKLARERWGDERYERALRDRTAFADEGEEFRGWEYLMPLARPLNASVFDYLRDTTLVVDEPAEVEKQIRSTLEELWRGYERAEAVDELALEPDKLFLTPDELRGRIGDLPRVELRLLGSAALAFEEELATEDVNVVLSPEFGRKDSVRSPGSSRNDSDPGSLPPEGGAQNIDAAPAPSEGGTTSRPAKGGTTNHGPLFLFPPEPKTTEVEIPSRAVRRWHGRFGDLAAELKRQSASGYQTIFVLPSSGVADRISKALNEYDALGAAGIIVGDLSAGFALPQSALNIYTEGDIFDEAVHGAERQAKTKRSHAAAFLSDFRDLKVGDYVVHIDHGIGQFQGLVQLDTSGPETSAEIYARMIGAAHRSDGRGKREFMLLTYADGAKLYAPVERLDLVQKYSSGDTHTPTLDRLGGIAWQKTKARAKRAMRDMAEELLKLYAERRLVKGYSFSGDT